MRKLRDKVANFATGGVLLTVAVVLGLATALLTLYWLNSEDEDAETAQATASINESAPSPDLVVIAREDLAAGDRITAEVVELTEVPAGTAPDNALSATSQAIGRVARYPLVAGEQLLESKLVDDISGDGLAFSIPPGMRAVSVPFSEVMGAGGLLVPGDRVDVLVSTAYERLFGPGEVITPADSAGHPTVIMVLQNMLVLAIGQAFTPTIDDGRDPATLRAEDAEIQPGARSVTLAVTPEQAQLLFMAAQEGTLGLALRPFGDESETALAPQFRLEALIGAAESLAALPRQP